MFEISLQVAVDIVYMSIVSLSVCMYRLDVPCNQLYIMDSLFMTGDECTRGHYCPSGSSLPKPCDPGYYVNRSQSAECDPCPARYFCTNQVKPLPCSPGK